MKIKNEEQVWDLSMSKAHAIDPVAYSKGYNQAQSDLLESASDGFEEWELDVNWSNAFRDHRSAALESWQTCSLRHAKLIKEKDERIKELEEVLNND